MKVLIVGGGGREHALAWKVAQSQKVDQVYVAPGNAGTAIESKVENVEIAVDDQSALSKFALENDVGLTIIGPEVPLVGGIVDHFNEAGLRCLGPSKKASQLEGSKVFCKKFLHRHGIPTASYEAFSDLSEALDYLQKVSIPVVVKADGLAAGKGVVIAESLQQACEAVEQMLSGNVFGEAGHRVVIEEYLPGEEASFIVVANGEQVIPMATSQDHKPRDEGDKGPNTGGMGAYSPAPVVNSEVYRRIMAEIIQPTLAGLAAEGMPYTGFLFAGLMISPNGAPKLLEYNCRFGDPETQPVLMRLKSDFFELCNATVNGQLQSVSPEWDSRSALGVVLASGGYPGEYSTGNVISGLLVEGTEETKIFHAGTQRVEDQVVTSGGRVLCACALGDTLASAQRNAYKAVDQIHWDKMYYRRDIGYREIGR